MKPTPQPKAARIQATILAVLVLALIWLPTLDTFFHLDNATPPNENRALAKMPEFHFGQAGLQKYIASLELYFNDHFGFRKRLIRLHHKWDHEIFKRSLRDDVLAGKDGWLFYSGERIIENIQGLNLFTDAELKEWQKLLESRRDWCARHGCAYLFVITPDKSSIYPELLPDWLQPMKHPNRIDQFMAYMAQHSTVPILDLRPALLAAKGKDSLYLLSDTHWNRLGAYFGYEGLIQALSKQVPGLKPVPLDSFELKWEPEKGGDLARMLGEDQSTTETANANLVPLPPLKPMKGIKDSSLLPGDWLKDITEPTYTLNPEAKGKVIMHHDSFAMSWVSLLGYNFNQVIYIWKNNWDTDFLEHQKPDVVIDQMLERFVISKDPNHLTENW